MKRRLPFYEQVADVIVEIDGKKRQQIADELAELFKDQI